jgi:hypothetical protein
MLRKISERASGASRTQYDDAHNSSALVPVLSRESPILRQISHPWSLSSFTTMLRIQSLAKSASPSNSLSNLSPTLLHGSLRIRYSGSDLAFGIIAVRHITRQPGPLHALIINYKRYNVYIAFDLEGKFFNT